MPRTAVNRPTVVSCDMCGAEVAVKPTGAVPRYCDDHKDPQMRRKMVERAEAEAARDMVCRWEFCEIPLSTDWPNDYCPNHWRLLSLETRGELINHPRGSLAYDRAVLAAIKEIRLYEGRAAVAAEKLADQTEVG